MPAYDAASSFDVEQKPFSIYSRTQLCTTEVTRKTQPHKQKLETRALYLYISRACYTQKREHKSKWSTGTYAIGMIKVPTNIVSYKHTHRRTYPHKHTHKIRIIIFLTKKKKLNCRVVYNSTITIYHNTLSATHYHLLRPNTCSFVCHLANACRAFFFLFFKC